MWLIPVVIGMARYQGASLENDLGRQELQAGAQTQELCTVRSEGRPLAALQGPLQDSKRLLFVLEDC